MRLLRVDALLGCEELQALRTMAVNPKMDEVVKAIVGKGTCKGSYTSHDLLAQYWHGAPKTTASLFPESSPADSVGGPSPLPLHRACLTTAPHPPHEQFGSSVGASSVWLYCVASGASRPDRAPAEQFRSL